jgi:subtilisin family serine protease
VSVGGNGHSITDSPNANYADKQDNWARLANPLNLSGLSDCRVNDAPYISSAEAADVMTLEASTSTSGPWTVIRSWSGSDNAVRSDKIPAFSGQSSVYLRIHFVSNGSVNGFGGAIDNLSVACAGAYTSANYAFLQGTSMATPHVAGVATLVAARFPTITTVKLRAKLLASVDVKAGLASVVATSGRINALKAVTNTPPTASAGGDKTVNTNASFTLDASASSDPENSPLTYTWSQIGGPAVTINNKNSAIASVTAPASATTLTFRVTVTDAQGGSSTDDITVTVKAPK